MKTQIFLKKGYSDIVEDRFIYPEIKWIIKHSIITEKSLQSVYYAFDSLNEALNYGIYEAPHLGNILLLIKGKIKYIIPSMDEYSIVRKKTRKICKEIFDTHLLA